jgi:hypothetical protein
MRGWRRKDWRQPQHRQHCQQHIYLERLHHWPEMEKRRKICIIIAFEHKYRYFFLMIGKRIGKNSENYMKIVENHQMHHRASGQLNTNQNQNYQ